MTDEDLELALERWRAVWRAHYPNVGAPSRRAVERTREAGARACALHARGVNWRAIAEELELSKARVFQLLERGRRLVARRVAGG